MVPCDWRAIAKVVEQGHGKGIPQRVTATPSEEATFGLRAVR